MSNCILRFLVDHLVYFSTVNSVSRALSIRNSYCSKLRRMSCCLMRKFRLSSKQIASNELTSVSMSSSYFSHRDWADCAHARISITLLQQADLEVQCWHHRRLTHSFLWYLCLAIDEHFESQQAAIMNQCLDSSDDVLFFSIHDDHVWCFTLYQTARRHH